MPHTFNRFVREWTDRRVQLNEKKLRLLLVDDDRNAVEALAAFMTVQDLDCHIALGGRQAIAAALAWAPHIIVMDISMPECTGIEAARAIREDDATAHILIIAFTALDEREVRRRAVDQDFDAYCQKGHATTHLLRLIASLAA
ncbi:response regulator [Caballeronia sordidicola]|uniref:Response regulator n=1 Tax=Caballeronia sordidicola TaxID=196367 RepID=A0A158I0Y7_CABSO|nr:response regulator [Caballeronia sordidicola]SAL50285.1 response regulator [Caballeronia sordidicola]